MSIKTAKLRKILNKKLAENITEDELFSPGNPNFIFDPRGLMLPFVATAEDNEKYQDESFGDGQLTDEEKIQLLKDQSYDGDEIKKSDDYIDVESEDQNTIEKAIKILRDKPDSINFFIERFGEENVPDDLKNLIPPQSKIPAGDIIEDVEKVASIKTKGGLLDSTSGLFDLPEFVKDLGPQLKANATEEEKNDYILNVVMGSINPGSKLGVVGDKSFKNLHKIVSKMFNKADDAKTTAIAYEGFRRKGNLIGANVNTMEDFTSIIKNPKKVLNENQVNDYLELAEITAGRSATIGASSVFVWPSINKSGKLVVKITKGQDAKKIITITEPTLQKLIDKGFKLGNF
jgi:hypothetical protein